MPAALGPRQAAARRTSPYNGRAKRAAEIRRAAPRVSFFTLTSFVTALHPRSGRRSASPTARSSHPDSGPRVQVRESPVHGKGVFARRAIPAGARILEYRGERIGWKEALRRHPHDPAQPHHTFYFSLETGGVIDAHVGGNQARWINHSCAPNCEAREIEGRVFIHALRDLQAGEELFYDYHLSLDERHTARRKQEYACHCGAADCRGTMLARKR